MGSLNTVSHSKFSRTSMLLFFTVSALTIVGVVLRLHLLTSRPLWDDEAASVIFAHLPWRDLVATMEKYEANMCLYYLLLRGWLSLGDSETAVRGLSVLFGAAAIPMTYACGKVLFNRQAGIVAAAFATVNEYQIRYSQEARSYSLVMLFALASTYCLVRAMDEPRNRTRWLIYVLFGGLGVYVHVFFYLVLCAQWVVLLPLMRKHFKPMALALAGLAVLTGPMTLFLTQKNQGQLNWVKKPSARLLMDFANLFTGYGGAILFALCAVLCLVAILAALRTPSDSTASFGERYRVALIASWLIFPIALTILVSYFEPIFYDRYMAISAPALALLMAKGVVDLDRIFPRFRFLAAAAVVLVLALSARGIRRYDDSPNGQGDNWRQVTQYILAGQQNGDGAFFYRASGSRPFVYYSRREVEKHTVAFSPSVMYPVDITNALLFNVDPNTEQVKQVLQGPPHDHVWLVLQHWEDMPHREAAKAAIEDALKQLNYHESAEEAFRGETGPIHVVLYVRDAKLAGNQTRP